MLKKIKFHNNDAKEYLRTYANTAFVQSSPSSNLVIDFYEEYVEPTLIMEQNFEENEVIYNNESDIIEVQRVRKCSVVVSREQALKLAKLILEETEENEGEDYENSTE